MSILHLLARRALSPPAAARRTQRGSLAPPFARAGADPLLRLGAEAARGGEARPAPRRARAS